MSKFKRGIENHSFIDALNKERYDHPDGYWSKMVKDKDLFIAIRNESINVYYKGNSICKLSYKKNQVTAAIHYKYLLHPQMKDVYVTATDGRFQEDILLHRAIRSLADIDLIKRASDVYAADEKSGVHPVVTKGNNVIDVEITFSGDEDEESTRSTDRIDYLKLEREKSSNADIRLVFYEAKHFTNKEIRSTGTPKVFGQITAYEKALKEHEGDILASYALVSKNLLDLDLIGNRDLIGSVASNPKNLSVDPKPRLIIFGYDRDQQGGKTWSGHRAKLEKELGPRLKTIGNP